MSCRPTKIPYCFPVGRLVQLRAEFLGQLPDGVLLTGTPVVTEIETPHTLSIGIANVNVGEETIDGVDVVAGQAVIAAVEVIAAKHTPTVVRIKCGTTNPQINVMADFEFNTRP